MELNRNPSPAQRTRLWRWPGLLLQVWTDSEGWRSASLSGKLNAFLEDIERAANRQPPVGLPPSWVLGLVAASASLHPHWFRQRCLFRCLLVYALLVRARVPVVIHFGCRFDQSSLRGHCWLTSACASVPRALQQPGGTQEVAARVYLGSENGFLWRTSYSQTSATAPANSALPEKQWPAPVELGRPTTSVST